MFKVKGLFVHRGFLLCLTAVRYTVL